MLRKVKGFYLKVTFICVWERQSFSTNECVMTVQFLSIDSLLSLEQNICIVYLDI